MTEINSHISMFSEQKPYSKQENVLSCSIMVWNYSLQPGLFIFYWFILYYTSGLEKLYIIFMAQITGPLYLWFWASCHSLDLIPSGEKRKRN